MLSAMIFRRSRPRHQEKTLTAATIAPPGSSVTSAFWGGNLPGSGPASTPDVERTCNPFRGRYSLVYRRAC
jgi:hypothetical protein